jgi:hypothetical protein
MDLCKYKNIIGEPNTGLRKKYRVFDVAIIDTVTTLLFVWAVSYFSGYPFVYTLVITFVIMVISHRMFCVRTTTDRWLFPDEK